jgi:hypothetical protein
LAEKNWLPDYGVGMFAMANLTYVGPAAPISQAWDVLLKTGGLQKRELPASPVFSQMRDHIVKLWKSWNDSEAGRIAAISGEAFHDYPLPRRKAPFIAFEEARHIGSSVSRGRPPQCG